MKVFNQNFNNLSIDQKNKEDQFNLTQKKISLEIQDFKFDFKNYLKNLTLGEKDQK